MHKTIDLSGNICFLNPSHATENITLILHIMVQKRAGLLSVDAHRMGHIFNFHQTPGEQANKKPNTNQPNNEANN